MNIRELKCFWYFALKAFLSLYASKFTTYLSNRAYDRYFEKVTKAYVENCDDSKIEGWLYLVMPDEYDMFVPYVKMAMEYVGKYFYENPRLPGCDG